jgi:purine-binding chemotaxis protein CheW
MDPVRIRPEKRERAREPDLTPVPPPAAPRLEEALRDELAARDRATSREQAAPLPADPLDDFFWREDETAPGLPDVAGAAAMPPPEPGSEALREYLTFFLGGEEYGLPIEHVREVLKSPVLTEVPRAPAHVLGVMMLRGEVIAVFDPRHELGVAAAAPDRGARVLICDAGEGPRGLQVDAVSQVVRLPPSALEPRTSSLSGSADCIAGVGRDRGRFVILLDTAALLRGALRYGWRQGRAA